MKRTAAIVLICASLCGCATTPAGRALNYQSHQAAVEGASIAEALVRDNMELESLIRPLIIRFEAIEQNTAALSDDIGAPDPEDAVAFSPESSAQFRVDLADQVSRRGFWRMVGGAGIDIVKTAACNSGIPGLGTGVAILLGALGLTAAAGVAAEVSDRKKQDA